MYCNEYLILPEEIPVFKRYCIDMSVIEIGTGYCQSTKEIALYASEVVSFDLFEIHEKGRTLTSTYKQAVDEMKDFKNVVLINENSKKAGVLFKNKYFDVAFIDGEHDYISVITDYFCIKSKIKKNGYILFHDYNDKHEETMSAINDILKFDDEVVEVEDECKTIKIFRKIA